MKIAEILTITLLLCTAAFASEGDSLIELAKQHDLKRYEFAVNQGAIFSRTSDGRSFYILWKPEGFDTLSQRKILATLHGHASFATDEFYLWYDHCRKRNIAILALQWYFGGDESTNNYYRPNEVYPIFESVLRIESIRPGNCVFHGFSRGSANTYGIAAYDFHTGNRFFGLVISNSGSAEKDYPVNIDINTGKFGDQPFTGSSWILYCGRNDDNVHSDCSAMENTEKWIMQLGGKVELFIKDEKGGHGGFHMNSQNASTALDLFIEISR